MDQAPLYSRWEDLPAHLQTRTQLGRQGLRPPRGQAPAARIERSYRGSTWTYDLYDSSHAIPKRQPTPAQLAALALARQRAHHARHYGTCPLCGDPNIPRDILTELGQCWDCQEAEEEAQRTADRDAAVQWARQVLADPRAVVLDTETTDLDGEIIEVAVLMTQGKVLFESLVRPLGDISPGAHAVHGLTLEDLSAAPSWPQIHAQVAGLLTAASCVVVYNAPFDYGVLDRTCWQYGLPSLAEQTQARWTCAMRWYAQWVGDWSDYHGDYRWYPLGGGHRAHADCLAVLELLHTMARQEEAL